MLRGLRRRSCCALDPQPDLIVHTGDLTDFGLPEEYAHLKAILAPLAAPILADSRQPRRARGDARRRSPRKAICRAQGFLHYAVERGPLRFVGLDTLVPGQGGGELCAERLAWLDATLGQKPDMPTLVLMHHPPFLTGIAHMDRIGLAGRDGFAAVMRRHDQVQAILCGHVHRPTVTHVGGRPAMICPSPAHQVALDLRPEGAERLPARAAGLHAAPLAGWAARLARGRARRLAGSVPVLQCQRCLDRWIVFVLDQTRLQATWSRLSGSDLPQVAIRPTRTRGPAGPASSSDGTARVPHFRTRHTCGVSSSAARRWRNPRD